MNISRLIQLAYLLIDFTLSFLNTVFEWDYFGLIPKVVVLVENERPEGHQPRAHACVKTYPCKYFFLCKSFSNLNLNEKFLIFILIKLSHKFIVKYAILKAKKEKP